MCRNFEWQVCAAKGLLPGQGGRTIQFSHAPSALYPDGSTNKPVGECCGWTPLGSRPRGGSFGYATDDIFYLVRSRTPPHCTHSAPPPPPPASVHHSVLVGVYHSPTAVNAAQETCLFNEICNNREELFSLGVGDSFVCDFSEKGFNELQRILLSPWHEPAGLELCWESKTCIELSSPGDRPTCDQCYRVNNGPGDCSALPGCDNNLCGFCSNESPLIVSSG